MNTMEFVVRSLRGFAVPLVVPVARAKRSFGEGGQPLDERLEAQLLNLGREVALICLGRRPYLGLKNEKTRHEPLWRQRSVRVLHGR